MNNNELKVHISEVLINHYAKVSKDVNPIHLDKEKALAAGLPDKIAHGMLSMALSTKMVTPYLCKGWFVSSYEVKLSFPVFVDDTIVIKANLIKQTNYVHWYKIIGFNNLEKKILQGTIKLQKLAN